MKTALKVAVILLYSQLIAIIWLVNELGNIIIYEIVSLCTSFHLYQNFSLEKCVYIIWNINWVNFLVINETCFVE